MSDDEMTLLTVRVEEAKKNRVKQQLEHGGITREMRKTLDRLDENTDSEKERLKDELQEAREKREDKVANRDKLNTDIERLNSRIERLENDIDALRDKEGEYEGHLQSIETMLHEENARVFEDHGQVIKAAEAGDCEPADVITDLKERNPELPEHRFTVGT